MAVGGLPDTRVDHAVAAAQLALAMRSAVQQFNSAGCWGCRCASAWRAKPVVAGVVGTQRFSYDLWGQTVSVAAGLESYGTPGKIQVSGATYLRCRSSDLRPCDPVVLRGIGTVEAWHLEGFWRVPIGCLRGSPPRALVSRWRAQAPLSTAGAGS